MSFNNKKILLSTAALSCVLLGGYNYADAACSAATSGDDTINCTSVGVSSPFDALAGNDLVDNNAGSSISGSVILNDGNDSFTNNGTVNNSSAITVVLGDGNDVLTNIGQILLSGAGDSAVKGGTTGPSNNSVDNQGTIQANVSGNGIVLERDGDNTISNSGLIEATKAAIQTNESGTGVGSLDVTNSGTITSTTDGKGVESYTSLTLNNTGTINATAGAGPLLSVRAGAANITNSGVLQVATGKAIESLAVASFADSINNTGSITGDIVLLSGNDTLVNTGSGSINGRVDLGTGEDAATIDGGTFTGSFIGGLGNDTLTLNNDNADISAATEFSGDVGFANLGGDVLIVQSNKSITMDLHDTTGKYREWETITNAGSGDVIYQGASNISTSTINIDTTGKITVDTGANLSNATLQDTVGNNNNIVINGTVANVSSGDGDDTITSTSSGGEVVGILNLGDGNDSFDNTGKFAGNLILDDTASKADDGNDTVTNSGTIESNIDLRSGNDSVSNTGTIEVNVGTVITLGDGNDTINNDGGVIRLTTVGTAAIRNDATTASNNTIFNSGTIDAPFSSAISLDNDGDNTVTNQGVITASNVAISSNLAGTNTGSLLVDNDGTITSTTDGRGVESYTTLTVDNSGLINATGGANSLITSRTGILSVINSGTISAVLGRAIESLSLGANSDTVTNTGSITGETRLQAGADVFTSTGAAASISGNVSMGDDNDTATINGGTYSGTFTGGNEDDTLFLDNDNTDITSGFFFGDEGIGEDGNDVITIQSNKAITVNVDNSSGQYKEWQTIIHQGTGTITYTGDDSITDTINVEGNAVINIGPSATLSNATLSDTVGNNNTVNINGTIANVNVGAGNDTVTINLDDGGLITGTNDGGAGNDILAFSSTGGNGTIGDLGVNYEDVQLTGDQTFIMSGVTSTVTNIDITGVTSLSIDNTSNVTATGGITAGSGNNTIANDGTLSAAINPGDGDDLFVNTGNHTGNITMDDTTTKADDGNDTVTNTGTIVGNIDMRAGNDTLTSNNDITGDIDMNDGNDAATINGGAFSGTFTGGAGDDTLYLDHDNATIGSSHFYGDNGAGDTGNDVLTVQSNSAISLNVDDGTSGQYREWDTVTNQGSGDVTYTGNNTSITSIILDSTGVLNIGPVATLTNATINDTVGNDNTININGTIAGINAGAGDDSVNINLDNGGTVTGTNDGGLGDDTLNYTSTGSNATINSFGTGYENVDLEGDTTFTISGLTSTVDNLNLIDDTDLVIDNTSNLTFNVGLNGGTGDNAVTIAGTIDGPVSLGDGDDTFTVSGVVDYTDGIDGGPGTDTFVLDGITQTIDGADITNFENLDLTNNSDLTFTGSPIVIDTVDIDSTSMLTASDLTSSTITNDGTFGNSGGSTIVTGDFVNNNGTLQIIVDSDDASSSGTSGVVSGLTVNGTLTLGASSKIDVSNLSGSDLNNFTVGESYDVISATSLVNNGVTVNTPTLPSGLSWATNFSSTGLQLLISNIPTPPPAGGCTGTDHNSNQLCQLLNNVSITTLNKADADQLTPEGYLAMLHTLGQASDNFIGNLRDRLGELRGMRKLAVQDQDCGVWGRVHGNMYSTDNDNNGHHGYDSKNLGVSVGSYCSVDEDWLLGGALGYSQGSVDHKLNFDGDLDSYHAAIYATYRQPEFHFDGILSYGMAKNDAERDINVTTPTSFAGTAKSSFDSKVLAAHAEAGYDFYYNKFEIEPWIALEYQKVMSDSLSESGAGTLNLSVEDADIDSFRGKIGFNVRGRVNIENSENHILPQARVYYQRDFKDQAIDVDYQLLGQQGNADGVERARDTLVFGFGFTSHINSEFDGDGSHNIYGHYDHEIGLDEDTTNHRFSIGYKYKF